MTPKGKFRLLWNSKGKGVLLKDANPEVLKKIAELYFKEGYEKYEEFCIHSEYQNEKGTKNRAHPCYWKKPWHDWVTIYWDKDDGGVTDPVPAKLMALVSYIDENGFQCHNALVWSANTNGEPEQWGVIGKKFFMQMENNMPYFQNVDASLLGPHVFCFPNFGKKEKKA